VQDIVEWIEFKVVKQSVVNLLVHKNTVNFLRENLINLTQELNYSGS
jgi:hypothetical protein